MEQRHGIARRVMAARHDPRKAEDLIRDYLPFIRGEASKFLGRFCTEQDDENSIAMIAFHEAMESYSPVKGAFLPYASLVIRSRLTDYARREARHQDQVSLDAPISEEGASLMDMLEDGTDRFDESAHREAARQEILELGGVLATFGLSFSDIADNCPRQARTLEACAGAIRWAASDRELLEQLLRTKKVPMARLALGSGVERKTLERHRKYILAMLVIQTNGYEIIRGHLRRVLGKGGARV